MLSNNSLPSKLLDTTSSAIVSLSVDVFGSFLICIFEVFKRNAIAIGILERTERRLSLNASIAIIFMSTYSEFRNTKNSETQKKNKIICMRFVCDFWNICKYIKYTHRSALQSVVIGIVRFAYVGERRHRIVKIPHKIRSTSTKRKIKRKWHIRPAERRDTAAHRPFMYTIHFFCAHN